MALLYISSVEVSPITLIVLIAAQMLGAYISPRFVMRLPEAIIKRFIAASLLIAAAIILLHKLGWFPAGGQATELTGAKLIIVSVLMFLFGIFNNLGIGSYAPTMAAVYLFGMNPLVAFPIMMGAAAFSVPIAGAEFIKLGGYSRKITLFTSTFGLLGVLTAVFFVKSLDVEN